MLWLKLNHVSKRGHCCLCAWFTVEYILWILLTTYMKAPDCMMTSSNGNIFRLTGPLCGEFTGPGEFPSQRPVTRNFDVFFDLRLNKRLSKQSWGWWFETPSRPLWRHRNVIALLMNMVCLLSEALVISVRACHIVFALCLLWLRNVC